MPLYTYSKDIVNESQEDRYAKNIEQQADRKFIEQNFDKAMKKYESAFKRPLSEQYSSALHLKIARLYLTLLDYKASVPHYESAMSLSENLFSIEDICNYLDALRYSGQKIKAMSIANKYANLNRNNPNQRYQNILHALNYENGFLPIGLPEFFVRPVESVNSNNSEFWIGVVDNKCVYATSNSSFHDPHKSFYHHTKYYSIDEKSVKSSQNKNELLEKIPSYLKDGALSFSEDMSKMIATDIVYDKGEGIALNKQGLNTFQTKLFYSEYNTKRKGWSSYREVFPDKKGFSYSHPFLFNKGNSILFSSNIEGGLGGFDIYIAHWNQSLRVWGDPINLGPRINTMGDEISPCLFNDKLIFSSDGHAGFGGYDIYGINFLNEQVVYGTLTHFDYPINTVYNDFSMLHIEEDRGYIVSDRATDKKDDIFYFERNAQLGNRNLLYGMSESMAIANGAINLAGNTTSFNTIPQKETLPKFEYTYDNSLSLYFDFDQYDLLSTSSTELNSFMRNLNLSEIDFLLIEGYADEMGTDQYNFNLSAKRAQAVVQWLVERGIDINVDTVGRGRVSANHKNITNAPTITQIGGDDNATYTAMWDNRIWENRTARRVDIKAISK